MQTYTLCVTPTGKQIISRQSDLTLLEWKVAIEKRILGMTSKKEYHEIIQQGSTIAGWSDYYDCVKNLTVNDVLRIMKVEEGCHILLVKQNDEYGIIVREGGQEKVIKGNVKRFEKYKIVKSKKFTELQMFKNKDTKFIELLQKEYFG